MKRILKLSVFIITFQVSGQLDLPFFEQIAFDFYTDSILTIHPIEKRLKVFKYTKDSHPSKYLFSISTCLTGQYLTEGKELELFSTYALEQNDWDAPNYEYDYSNLNKTRFRIKTRPTNKYNRLNITAPYFEKENFDIFYLIIIEEYQKKRIIYYLKMDLDGEVLNWCRSQEQKVIIH